jgi:hypothetical protein
MAKSSILHHNSNLGLNWVENLDKMGEITLIAIARARSSKTFSTVVAKVGFGVPSSVFPEGYHFQMTSPHCFSEGQHWMKHYLSFLQPALPTLSPHKNIGCPYFSP